MKKFSQALLYFSVSLLAFGTIDVWHADADEPTQSQQKKAKINIKGKANFNYPLLINADGILEVSGEAVINSQVIMNDGEIKINQNDDNKPGKLIFNGNNTLSGTGIIDVPTALEEDSTNSDTDYKDEDQSYKEDDNKLAKYAYYELVNESGQEFTTSASFKKYAAQGIYKGKEKVDDVNDVIAEGSDITINAEPVVSAIDAKDTAVLVNGITKVKLDGTSDNYDMSKDNDTKVVIDNNEKKTVDTAFYSLEGYTQYADRGPYNNNEEAVEAGKNDNKYSDVEKPVLDDSGNPTDGKTLFKFNKDNGDYTPIYLPKPKKEVVILKTTDGETDYERNLIETNLNPDSFAFTQFQDDDPVVEFTGNNSWFNETFTLERGGVIINNKGKIFGGKINIGTGEFPTEFEWQGGAKDEYNKPDIFIGDNSTLFMNVPNEGTNNGIFSLYGNISGGEKSELIFEKGEIYIKGNCDNFKGKVGVVQGARFEVRSSDENSSSEYTGSFPNANITQLDSEGNKVTGTTGEATVIDSQGIQNVTVENGHIKLKHTSETRGETDNTVQLKGSTISREALLTIENDADITDVTVQGVAVTEGNLNATNLTIDGGILAIKGPVTTANLEAGSTIAMWGNDNIDNMVNVGRRFVIKDNHSLKIFTDVDYGTGQTDSLNIRPEATVVKSNGIQIGGINFMDDKELTVSNEGKTFHLLSDQGQTNIPVTIGAKYGNNNPAFYVYRRGKFNENNEITFSGGDAVYSPRQDAVGAVNYKTEPVEGKPGVWKVTHQTDTNNFFYVYGSESGGTFRISKEAGEIVAGVGTNAAAIMGMHLTGAKSAAAIFDMVSDSNGYYNSKKDVAKYEIWNKTFAEFDKYDTSDSRIKSNNWGTMFGFDGKPLNFKAFSSEIMPTVFAGFYHRHMTMEDFKAHQNGYVFGLKGTLFDSKKSLDVMASYEFLKTKHNSENTSINQINMKGHVVSLGGKFGYNFDLPRGFVFRPTLLGAYSFIKLPNFDGGEFAGSIKNKNLNRFEIVPALNVVKNFGSINAGLYLAYHQNFGTRAKLTTELNETTLNPDIMKKHYIEYGVNVDKSVRDGKAHFGLNITRKTCGVKGFKFTLDAGIKF